MKFLARHAWLIAGAGAGCFGSALAGLRGWLIVFITIVFCAIASEVRRVA